MRLLCMGIFVVLLFPGTLLLAADYSKPQGWDQLVEAARKEGKIVLRSGPDPAAHQAFKDFEKVYPGIKVHSMPIRGSMSLHRLATEYRARKYLVDIVGSTSMINLKPLGLYAPLKPALILPEVLDKSAWWGNRLWWVDAAEPYTMLNFQGIAQAYIAYNTNFVDPKQFNSWMDLLNPKYKGKIVSTDPRRRPNAVDVMHFIYDHPDLGPRYLKRFFIEMDVRLSTNYGQMGDWLGRGRFHLAFGLGSLATSRAAAQGLPVALMVTQRFKEGAPMTSSGRAVALLKRAPHPNAAKLYINWLLSREGQMAWQRRTKQNSLRVDIPKEGLRPETTPIPGQTYLFGSTEERRRARAPLRAFLRKILSQRGK